MSDKVRVRDLLNRANEAFYRDFGRLATPALVAGLIAYCLNLTYTRISHSMVLALWRHFQGNPHATTRSVIIPGIALQLVLFAFDLLVWGAALAIIARTTIARQRGTDGSLLGSIQMLISDPGWITVFFGLYLRIVLVGFVMKMALIPVEIPVLNAMHIQFTTPSGRLFTELFTILVFYLIFLIYACRFALTIPLPIAAGDRPVDPFRDSADASKPWRGAIIVSCLLVWGVGGLIDLHLPSILLGPGGIRPTTEASYAVYIAVSLLTSVLWAWLFVFLTEIAIVSAPAEGELFGVVPATE